MLSKTIVLNLVLAFILGAVGCSHVDKVYYTQGGVYLPNVQQVEISEGYNDSFDILNAGFYFPVNERSYRAFLETQIGNLDGLIKIKIINRRLPENEKVVTYKIERNQPQYMMVISLEEISCLTGDELVLSGQHGYSHENCSNSIFELILKYGEK